MQVVNFSDLDPNGYYTYQDYMTWAFPERVELYRGVPMKLFPAPNRRHQRISTIVQGELYQHLKNSECELFSAPFDVRLPITNKRGQPNTVVQPDLCVVCDPDKLDKQGCKGAPDLVIEILSPGNPPKEVREKYSLYEESGVIEYWLIQPEQETVLVYLLNDNGKFIGLRPLNILDTIESTTLSGFKLDLKSVFAQ